MNAKTKERRAWGTGRIFKRKRSRFYYIRYYDANGKRRTEATGTTSEARAEERLRDILGDKKRGELNPDAHKVTFEQLVEVVKSDRVKKRRRSALKLTHLTETFKGYRATQITTVAVDAFEAARLEAGAARATVNNELALLRRAFNLAVEKRLLLRTQVPLIKTPDPKNARQGFFERDDFEAVVKELPDYLRPAMRFGYLTGWRVRSEVLPLTWSQIDFKAGIVRLEPNTTKNDEGRAFPFDVLPELAALLHEQKKRRVGLFVFHYSRGEPIRDYRAAWQTACESAAVVKHASGLAEVIRPQVVGRLVHDLRRTAVRNLERAGVSRSVAMSLTGHKTEAVYRRYAIVDSASQREGVAKLAKLA